MVKKFKIVKERKREELVNKYYELCKELKVKGDYEVLRKLLRDLLFICLIRRCKVIGRFRGVLCKFEMFCIVFREYVYKG